MTDAVYHHASPGSWARPPGWLLGAGVLVLTGCAVIVAGGRLPEIFRGPFFGGIDVAGLMRALGLVLAAKPTLLIAGELAIAGAVRLLDRGTASAQHDGAGIHDNAPPR